VGVLINPVAVEKILEGSNRAPLFKPYMNSMLDKLSPNASSNVRSILEQDKQIERTKS
jgi:hypothetical protein